MTWPRFQLLNPSECEPPHRITHPEKLFELAEAFTQAGWSVDHPVLVGYPNGTSTQLLSGTHRHGAAELAGIKVPVHLWSITEVWAAWGDTEAWARIMSAPLLCEVNRNDV